MNNKHALITGGAGFIGSHLADKLIERGFDVTILDNLLPQVHQDDVKDARDWPDYLNPKARKIKADILSPNVFEKALEGVTHLVHLAASVGVGQSMVHIVDYTRNNTLAAAVILETLAKGKHTIERMAVASSMSIYGEGAYFSSKNNCIIAPPPREMDQVQEKKWEVCKDGETLISIPTHESKSLMPASIYAINKRDHEEMFLVMGKALHIPTVALRIFNTYGSNQSPSNPYTGVVAIFISRLLNDLPPLIFEDGKQMRDFVHVNDVAQAFSTVLECDQKLWDVFNVGSGKQISIYAIAKLLAKILNKKIEPEILNHYRMGDIRHCFADITKMEQVFGFRPKIDLEEGMTELVKWVKKCPKPIDRMQENISELKQKKLII
ncbi:MAG TPA: NAD-dependent epimerase/dehydratase family protein [Chlamydiales bacterium]|nr:MAG: epimerase [Verrucomicrobia bacterium RIFCSPHIGHO2_12_FULL_41_10]HLB52561.1 NAD-dependent epimerase/dehydratase family protein [Chlamydiales bacterium]